MANFDEKQAVLGDEEQRRRENARRAGGFFTKFVRALSADEASALRDAVADEERVIATFLNDRGAMKVMADLTNQIVPLIQRDPRWWRYPDALGNIAAMLAVLGDTIVTQLFDGRPPTADLRATIAALTRQRLDLVEAQVAVLRRAVVETRNYLTGDLAGVERVLLLEFPVSNSLPVKCLAQILADDSRVATARCALHRNDRRARGMRRADLAGALLDQHVGSESTLVVYMDEWFTGSNFKKSRMSSTARSSRLRVEMCSCCRSPFLAPTRRTRRTSNGTLGTMTRR